jgi:hypothetical protein
MKEINPKNGERVGSPFPGCIRDEPRAVAAAACTLVKVGQSALRRRALTAWQCACVVASSVPAASPPSTDGRPDRTHLVTVAAEENTRLYASVPGGRWLGRFVWNPMAFPSQENASPKAAW